MKKSTFYCLMSVIWALDTALAVIRFFDIHITVQNKEGKVIKELCREGDKPTPIRVVIAVLSLVICNLYAALFFKAKKEEGLVEAICDC